MSRNICFSTQMYPPALGGVAVAARRLVEFLTGRLGQTVHVVTPTVTTRMAEGQVETSAENGATVHRVAQRAISNGTKFVLADVMTGLDERIGFDLYHGFFLPSVYPCILATELTGRTAPVVASIRGNDVLTLKDHPLHRPDILFGLDRATWITSVNQAYLDRVSEEVDIAGRSSVIRNSVATPAPDAEPWRLCDRRRGRVGVVGEFRKVKDVPLLVRAYAKVPTHLRRSLVLAGFFTDQAEQDWTDELIREFGLEDEVTLTGPFPHAEVFEHLRGLHVYVQSSAFEGMPNALMEAASLGIPLVATRVGGMAEILTDGETALLVDHGDAAALGRAVARVLSDDGLAASLSAGAQRLTASLSPASECEAWGALYQRLLGGRSTV